MAKKNSSPTVTAPITPPEITPPEITQPGNESGPVTPPTQPENPVLSLEELNKQMAEMRKAEAEREKREKEREEEHKKKMEEMDQAIDNASKENFNPSMNKILNDRPTRMAYAAKAEKMKNKLAKEPVKTIFIPKNPTEPDGIKFHVQLNGFTIEIPKDQYVDVPVTIWQTIVDSQKQIARAGEKYRLDLNGKLPRLEKSIDPVAPSTDQQ